MNHVVAAGVRLGLHDHRSQAVAMLVAGGLARALQHQDVVVAGAVRVDGAGRCPASQIAGMEIGAVVEVVQGIPGGPGHRLGDPPAGVVIAVALGRRVAAGGGADHPPEHVVAETARAAVTIVLGDKRTIVVVAEAARIGRPVADAGRIEGFEGLELVGGVVGVGVVVVVDVGIPFQVAIDVVAVCRVEAFCTAAEFAVGRGQAVQCVVGVAPGVQCRVTAGRNILIDRFLIQAAPTETIVGVALLTDRRAALDLVGQRCQRAVGVPAVESGDAVGEVDC